MKISLHFVIAAAFNQLKLLPSPSYAVWLAFQPNLNAYIRLQVLTLLLKWSTLLRWCFWDKLLNIKCSSRTLFGFAYLYFFFSKRHLKWPFYHAEKHISFHWISLNLFLKSSFFRANSGQFLWFSKSIWMKLVNLIVFEELFAVTQTFMVPKYLIDYTTIFSLFQCEILYLVAIKVCRKSREINILLLLLSFLVSSKHLERLCVFMYALVYNTKAWVNIKRWDGRREM